MSASAAAESPADEHDHGDGRSADAGDRPQREQAQRESGEAADDVGEHAPVREAAAHDDSDESSDAEGREDAGHELVGDSCNLCEQRREVGEGGEHRGLEQRRRAERQSNAWSLERGELGREDCGQAKVRATAIRHGASRSSRAGIRVAV